MFRKKKDRTMALLLFFGSICSAQEYRFRQFGNAEGLSNLAVRQIYQDHVGFLWVSTENGIFRYDGDHFEAFGPTKGIPPNSGLAFGDAPDGSLLVGGSIGLFQLRGNHFEKLGTEFETVGGAQGIADDGNGHTFLGTNAGLFKLTSKPGQTGFSMERVPQAPGTSGPDVSSVLVDGETIWYGCGSQLCRMTSAGIRVFGEETSLPKRPVRALRKDGSGNLWVRVEVEGLFELPAGQTRFRRAKLPLSSTTVVGAPNVDGSGRLLLPTPGGLLIRDGDNWKLIDESHGLRGAVYSVFEDRQHSLWVGLGGRGLVQWSGYGEWENYSKANGLPSDMVWEIRQQANGPLWVATEGGLVRGVRNTRGIQWSGVANLKGIPVHGLQFGRDGDIWVGTETSGVARLNPRSEQVKWFGERQGLTGKQAYTFCLDHSGRLWVATEAGLFVAESPYERFSREKVLPSSRIWVVREGSDGTLWVGGPDGLFALIAGHWKGFRQSDGLGGQSVLSLGAGANGTIWVGYLFEGGIDRVHLQSGTLIVEKAMQRPGMVGKVYFLGMDHSNKLWAGTEQGVDVLDGARWNHYDLSDGLAWNDCNLNAFFAASDGSVWIGTGGGLSHFKSRQMPGPSSPIQVVFTQLLMGQKEVSELGALSSGFKSNSLTARYSAVNASRPNGVTFRYRLLGATSNWSETTQRALQFAELAPGNYRLQIEASNGDQTWSGNTAEFAFRIPPPWYLSFWFLGLCALAPPIGAWSVFRWRTVRLEKEKLEFHRLKAAHDEIAKLAFYDALTSLPNRRLLMERLEECLASCARGGQLCALLFVDLDNFKVLNDTLGHQTGDLLLQEVAHRLSSTIRGGETVARWGGDEFVVILKENTLIPERVAARAETVGLRILTLVNQPYILDEHDWLSAASIGITVFGDHPESANEILKQADIAMYQAKAAGRNTVRFFAPALQAAVNARAALETDLHEALKTEQLQLYFQPQLENGVVFGVEALVRWNHPQRGILLPDEFIPLAEETGLIKLLGDWVLEAVCKQIAAWSHDSATASLSVAVNVSALQWKQPDFVARLIAILKRTGANPLNLDLELTEGVVVDDVEQVIAKMTQLRNYGIQFSMDDFGTGYSSLSYLKRLPLNRLKIDRSFVRDLLEDTTSRAIAEAIISLSRSLGLSVMAEGLESPEEERVLAQLGCHAFQGFLISHPQPRKEFERWFLERSQLTWKGDGHTNT
jgi:diguanylate cyclase (GGDEF)-like protein